MHYINDENELKDIIYEKCDECGSRNELKTFVLGDKLEIKITRRITLCRMCKSNLCELMNTDLC